jgi:hypothetical protein
MPIPLPASPLSGLRPAVNGWARAALAAAAVAALAGLGWHLAAPRGQAPQAAPVPVTPAAQRMQLEHCTEGALLRHDVRWAAVCMVLAQQDESKHAACLADPAIVGNPALGLAYCDRTFPLSDGSAECELPDAHTAPLYDRLHREEQRCLAEAGALRR